MTNKEIATYLRAQATQYPHMPEGESLTGWNPGLQEQPKALFLIDGLKIRCLPTYEHICQVADKFDKGPHSSCRPRQVNVGQCKEPVIRKMTAKQLYTFANECLKDGDTLDMAYYFDTNKHLKTV